jgi:hypothetical protein
MERLCVLHREELALLHARRRGLAAQLSGVRQLYLCCGQAIRRCQDRVAVTLTRVVVNGICHTPSYSVASCALVSGSGAGAVTQNWRDCTSTVPMLDAAPCLSIMFNAHDLLTRCHGKGANFRRSDLALPRRFIFCVRADADAATIEM